jgi:hypothetical protein
MSAAWQDFLRARERFRSGAADEYRELDSERVLILAEFNAREKVSGLKLDQACKKGVSVFHVRDGKVTRLLLYFDAERALADGKMSRLLAFIDHGEAFRAAALVGSRMALTETNPKRPSAGPNPVVIHRLMARFPGWHVR